MIFRFVAAILPSSRISNFPFFFFFSYTLQSLRVLGVIRLIPEILLQVGMVFLLLLGRVHYGGLGSLAWLLVFYYPPLVIPVSIRVSPRWSAVVLLLCLPPYKHYINAEMPG